MNMAFNVLAFGEKVPKPEGSVHVIPVVLPPMLASDKRAFSPSQITWSYPASTIGLELITIETMSDTDGQTLVSDAVN